MNVLPRAHQYLGVGSQSLERVQRNIKVHTAHSGIKCVALW